MCSVVRCIQQPLGYSVWEKAGGQREGDDDKITYNTQQVHWVNKKPERAWKQLCKYVTCLVSQSPMPGLQPSEMPYDYGFEILHHFISDLMFYKVGWDNRAGEGGNKCSMLVHHSLPPFL